MQGAGALYCDYGHLPFKTGDYIVLPRSHHVADRDHGRR